MGFLDGFILRYKTTRVLYGVIWTVWCAFQPIAWMKSTARFVPRLFKYAVVAGVLYLIWLGAPSLVARMSAAVAQVPPMPTSAGWFALAVAVMALGAGFFLFGLSAVLYTAWYFLVIARALDAQLAREFGATRRVLTHQREGPGAGESTEGSFHIVDDQKAAFKEELDQLKETTGMSDEEYQEHLQTIENYGVGTEV